MALGISSPSQEGSHSRFESGQMDATTDSRNQARPAYLMNDAGVAPRMNWDAATARAKPVSIGQMTQR